LVHEPKYSSIVSTIASTIAPALGLALGQQVEVADLGGREQVGGAVGARRHAGTAADARAASIAASATGFGIGMRLASGAPPVVGGDEAAGLDDAVERRRSTIRSLMIGNAVARHGSMTICRRS
jgi:hypothetical protein